MAIELRDETAILDQRVYIGAAWIRQQLSATNIDVNEVAKALNLSGSHFQHLFREHMGVTPQRYHKLQRLRRAQHLLRESSLNVKQVMAEVGWTDESHFCRDYKRVYGESPSKVRWSCVKFMPAQLTMA